MFLNADDIRAKFNIQPNAYGSQIDAAIDSAKRKVRVWVGEDVFDEADGETPPVGDDELLRYGTVIDAHSWLTMFYLSRAVGLKYSADGVIKQAQDAGSPAFNTRILTNEYLTPQDLGKREQMYYDTARDTIDPYLLIESSTLVTVSALPQKVSVVADW